VIVAKDQGFFEKRGLDISVSNFTSGKQCLDTVVGGGADIATIGLGLNRLVHRNRLKPVRSSVAKQWQDLQELLGSSKGTG